MKEKGTYLVPTIYLGDWFMENYQRIGVPEFMVEKAKVVMPAARQNIARAFKAGVKVAFGTDAAVYPHGLERARIRGDGEARIDADAVDTSGDRERRGFAWLV